MSRVAILREAGGLGDVTQCLAVARAHKAAGDEVTFFCHRGYADYVHRSPDVDRVIPVPPARRRPRDTAPDPDRWPYLACGGPYDEFVDLWCPAFRYERTCPGEVNRDRLALFMHEASVPRAGLGRIRLSPGERAAVEGLLAGKLGWGWRPFILLVPWSRGAARNWLAPRWRKLANALGSRGHATLTLADREGQRGRTGGAEFGDPGAPFWALWGLVARARLVVSVDTGPLHLAGALGVPCLGLFGCTAGRNVCRPYPTHRWIQARGCAPCYYVPGRGRRPECRDGCAAMRTITVGDVLAGIDAMLGERTKGEVQTCAAESLSPVSR